MDSIFSNVKAAAPDPIFIVTTKYLADKRPEKVNLGVGMYMDDDGKVGLLNTVKAEEEALSKVITPHAYVPMRGASLYRQLAQELVFGKGSDIVKSGRVATIQSLGGTGALKVGVDFLVQIMGSKVGAASDPTWGNHYQIITQAGATCVKYRYWDMSFVSKAEDINFGGMMQDLNSLPQGSFVILHACCHNPTGYGLSREQSREVLDVCLKKGLIPFLDCAYQGFDKGLEEDLEMIRLFEASGMNFLVASSFSKNFGLYGERVGALHVVAGSKAEADNIITHLEKLIRANYSNPPFYGARIVQNILSDEAKAASWREEVAGMRIRIRSMREALVSEMNRLGAKRDFSFITRQAGMFSYTGLSPEQMDRLAEEFAIYSVRNGRICVCGLNTKNVTYVAEAFCKIL